VKSRTSRWNISLWVAQVVLAAIFAIAGILKMTRSIPELVELMAWTGDVSPALVRFIGAAELAGAIGLILPAAPRLPPLLTPLAAAGLLATMSLASVFHAFRGEFDALPITLALGALASFVAWGRFRKVPIRRRRPLRRAIHPSPTVVADRVTFSPRPRSRGREDEGRDSRTG
jgi:putative oxidoreductase